MQKARTATATAPPAPITAPLHRQVPDWSLVSQKLAPSEELLQEDMTRWVAALDRLLPVMENMHKALDLEDQRKSL